MNPTAEQAAAFAVAAKRLRGDRGAPSVAKGMSERLGFTVPHQSIYQWEDPQGPKPETYDKVKALDDELGAGGELVRLLMPADEVLARLSDLERRAARTEELLDEALRQLPADG